MDIFYQALQDKFRVISRSEEEWKLFVKRSQIKRAKQGAFLIEAGELVNHAYFCSVGLFRLFYSLVDGKKYSQYVQVRFFDAEALPGKDYTDFAVCETEDLRQYHYMWEEVRDSLPYTKGFMKIKEVVMGMENAFQSYESDILKMEE